MEAGQNVNEKKREFEEIERQNAMDLADMNLIQNVSNTIKLMKLERGLHLLDYGRLRKAGDVETHVGKWILGDYAFLFDMTIILCYKPKWLQHRYRFREAIKIKDAFLEPPNPYDSNSLSIRCFSRVDPRKVMFTLVAKNKQEREAWFSALVTAMDAVNPSENESQVSREFYNLEPKKDLIRITFRVT